MYLSGQPLVNLSHNGYNIGLGDNPALCLSHFAYQQNFGATPDFQAVANIYALNPATVKLVKLPLDQIMMTRAISTAATTFTPYLMSFTNFEQRAFQKSDIRRLAGIRSTAAMDSAPDTTLGRSRTNPQLASITSPRRGSGPISSPEADTATYE